MTPPILKKNPRSVKKNQRSVPRVNGVYDRLRREILSGVIAPGEFLLEENLAERFKISRTPLREAFIHLYRDGLLQKGPYKGYVVTEVTLAIYREVFQLRLLLEPAAAKLAAQNPTADRFLDQAEQIVERMDSLAKSELTPEELLEAGGLDSSFHRCIAQASGNKRLVKFIDELASAREFSYAKYSNRPVDETVREHRSVLRAIKSGGAAEAEQAMLQHIRQALERAKELFLGGSSMGNLY
jgi:DNA-binding GntR family transcriptional regulator